MADHGRLPPPSPLSLPTENNRGQVSIVAQASEALHGAAAEERPIADRSHRLPAGTAPRVSGRDRLVAAIRAGVRGKPVGQHDVVRAHLRWPATQARASPPGAAQGESRRENRRWRLGAAAGRLDCRRAQRIAGNAAHRLATRGRVGGRRAPGATRRGRKTPGTRVWRRCCRRAPRR